MNDASSRFDPSEQFPQNLLKVHAEILKPRWEIRPCNIKSSVVISRNS